MIRKIAIKIASLRAKKSRTRKPHPSFAEAKKIGIVVDSSDVQTVLSPITKSLLKEGKEVVAVIIDTPTKEPKKLPQNCIRVTAKEFSQFGKVANSRLQSFLKTEFDFLFSLNGSPTLLIQNILASTSAKCRIGVYEENSVDYCDFMIAPTPNESLSQTAQRILKYSKEIR